MSIHGFAVSGYLEPLHTIFALPELITNLTSTFVLVEKVTIHSSRELILSSSMRSLKRSYDSTLLSLSHPRAFQLNISVSQ